jgi:hypothetical protein
VSRAETLVTVPQAVELEGITGAFTVAGHSGTRVKVGRQECQHFEQLGMLVAVCGHGKAQHAVQTQHLIDQRGTVRAVICAGAAGGLDPALKISDVVVGVTTVEHDYTLRFIQRPLPCHRADVDLVRELMRAVAAASGAAVAAASRDLQMPELDGVGLYQELARQQPSLLQRLAFVSGSTEVPEYASFCDRMTIAEQAVRPRRPSPPRAPPTPKPAMTLRPRVSNEHPLHSPPLRGRRMALRD